jgi:hypothetical protein
MIRNTIYLYLSKQIEVIKEKLKKQNDDIQQPHANISHKSDVFRQ